MFDNFEPFLKVQKQNFSFQPNRYEIWMKGQMVGSGQTTSLIVAKVAYHDGDEKMEILFDSPSLNKELAFQNIFDEFLTSRDRLQLVTIPNQTNVQNMGIEMFKMNIGATRNQKAFDNNEPYCCNLFLQNGTIGKITFSYSNPEKLVEFYNDALINYSNQKVDDLFYGMRNDFQKFRKKTLNLPLTMRFSCDVYDINNNKIINNEKGHFHLEAEEVILKTYDESGDYIRFYDNDGKLYCQYVVMGGQTIVHQEVGTLDINSKGLPSVNLKYTKGE